jgi:hypothetical protein
MSDRTCSFNGCDRPQESHHLCAAHSAQRRRGAPLKPLQVRGDDDARFVGHTRTLSNGCVEWTGCVDKGGYGRFGYRGKVVLAHRWRWQRDNGPLDPGLDLDHYRYPDKGCIGPACVLHVRPVTTRENMLRSDVPASWNRAKTHCKNGHPFDETNTQVSRRGSRRCRACRRVPDDRRSTYSGKGVPHRTDNHFGKNKTHCKHGHLFDAANTRITPNGRRRCRACHRIAARKAAQQT